MPVCPRCGKSLSSEQALMYHLNKKFRCGSWKCEKCSKAFDTKFDKNIHEMNCESTLCLPPHDILQSIFNSFENIEIGCKKEIVYKDKNIVIEYLKN